jgi:hypothetical protein
MASLQTGNVTTAVANVYVSTGNTVVTFLSLCNYSASNVTANVYVVPSGDTVGNLNMVISNILIATGDTYQFYAGNEKLILSNSDSIRANASANNSITTVASYTAA